MHRTSERAPPSGPPASSVDRGEELLLDDLLHFFVDEGHARDALILLKQGNRERKSGVSLRFLERICAGDSGVWSRVPLRIRISYKEELARFSKHHFDPFARRAKRAVTIGGEQVITSAAQLNFFRWAIRNDVLEYARSHCDELRARLAVLRSGGEEGGGGAERKKAARRGGKKRAEGGSGGRNDDGRGGSRKRKKEPVVPEADYAP